MKLADMKSYAKFKAICECGAKSPRFATDYTAARWMREHEAWHKADFLKP